MLIFYACFSLADKNGLTCVTLSSSETRTIKFLESSIVLYIPGELYLELGKEPESPVALKYHKKMRGIMLQNNILKIMNNKLLSTDICYWNIPNHMCQNNASYIISTDYSISLDLELTTNDDFCIFSQTHAEQMKLQMKTNSNKLQAKIYSTGLEMIKEVTSQSSSIDIEHPFMMKITGNPQKILLEENASYKKLLHEKCFFKSISIFKNGKEISDDKKPKVKFSKKCLSHEKHWYDTFVEYLLTFVAIATAFAIIVTIINQVRYNFCQNDFMRNNKGKRKYATELSNPLDMLLRD